MPGLTMRQRRLASELRRLREAKGFTGEQAAHRVGWQPSKISRIEHCASQVKAADLIILLDAYEVPEKIRRTLITLQEAARQRGWWDVYGDLPSDYSSYIELESDAVTIKCYSMQLVHGLLQTEEYARAVIEATLMGQVSAKEIERRIEVRMTRQSILRKPEPLNLRIVLDEAAVRRMMGGPEVMRGQCAHLLAQTEKTHVTIQILPNNVGAHPAVVGPFSVLALPGGPDVVYIETLLSSLYVEDDHDVHRYSLVFDKLCAMALDPDDSRDLLRAVATVI